MEIWKDVVGYEGLYCVSSFGRIKSLPRPTKQKAQEMSRYSDQKGYQRVWLCKDGTPKNYKVHRLVAQAFIPNPDELPQVNHKDENKANNCVDNLEWCDCRYNNTYNNRMGRIATKNSRKVRCFETNMVYDSISAASRAVGVSTSNIIYVCQGKFKQIKGYHFEYEDC